MSQMENLNQLLDDMDDIRPIVIAAMPDDFELRNKTRRMISILEQLRQSPGIPHDTYVWVIKLFAKFLDVEHGAMLRPTHSGTIPAESRAKLESQAMERLNFFQEAQRDLPATYSILDRSSNLIGKHTAVDASLKERAQHLENLIKQRLQQDSSLRAELHQLINAFSPSLEAISKVLEEAGEESPDLKLAKQLLEQDLPDDIDQARAMLQTAREGILKAGNKITSASEKLHETLQNNMQQLSQLSQQLVEAETEARNDPLTGLSNRRRLAEFLKELGQSNFCFVVVDIDHFKKINDTYGHDVGDEILQQVGDMLDDCTRKTDLAARVGGEEFCIVFPQTDLTTSARLAESLRESIAMMPFRTSGGIIELTISIGVAEHIVGKEHSITFKAADEALYHAKTHGRNQVTCAPVEKH
ncbi:diguanylate cyclase [Mariprofundus micogutta]|uniref:diguanylate cyclase n=1 Tax=Mariprofundus micogutta TaxID=1921010 RepID=A0A1L8CM88_9PROT|nr:diguanylate cyclase [Mariprofundus micogutta]GAV20021.1 diguanylate cyclase [Mariprofundus micogutta]